MRKFMRGPLILMAAVLSVVLVGYGMKLGFMMEDWLRSWMM